MYVCKNIELHVCVCRYTHLHFCFAFVAVPLVPGGENLWFGECLDGTRNGIDAARDVQRQILEMIEGFRNVPALGAGEHIAQVSAEDAGDEGRLCHLPVTGTDAVGFEDLFMHAI